MVTYKNSGVDIEAGYKAVDLIKKNASKTFNKNVINGIGGFGGLYSLESFSSMKKPTLVSGTDGVGTKIKLAFLLEKYDTIGIDCVAMCVNDIICCGAKPLFFMDYIAIDKLIPEKVAEIVSGVTEGCSLSECALIGGETAEMPGIYSKDEFDLAGFSVGIVDFEKIIDGSNIKKDNVLIGLKSSGVHSNGFSLVRKVFDFENKNLDKKLIEELLVPTQIYVKTIMSILEKFPINGISHITGGGFYENIPRMFNSNLSASINKNSYEIPEIFQKIQKTGNIDINEMYNVFNMGIGMVLAVDESHVDDITKIISSQNIESVILGKVINGDKEVILC